MNRLGRLVAILFGLGATPGSAQSDSLAAALDRIARSAPATVGIAIVHVETGREAFVNRSAWFPMASTLKVAIAVEVLARVDRGSLALDSLIPIERSDFVPFGSDLTDRFGGGPIPGVALSVRRYLELMLILSDNTATDVLLRLVGGTGSVQARITALGIDGMEVSRSINRLAADWFGFELPSAETRTLDGMRRLMAGAPPAQMAGAKKAFFASRRDHATPEAMARLLARIVKGDALGGPSTELLLEIMRREETGAARIRGRLPAGVDAGNKTGTLDVTVANDVGFIRLPDGTHLVLAVYLTGATAAGAPLDRVIAEVARAAYDHFATLR